jgi:SAM-dependent methyltransferase
MVQNASSSMLNAADAIYNDFYARRYDQLFHDSPNGQARFRFEIAEIRRRMQPRGEGERIRLLDLGCGTGRHCAVFSTEAATTGVDVSSSMLEVARRSSPLTTFIQGDMRDRALFAEDSFNYVLSLYGAVHYNRELDTILGNIACWLRPGGFACLGILDPTRLCAATSPESRQIGEQMVTAYPDCEYRSRWERHDDDRVSYHEIFLLFPWLETVERHHEFYMPEVAVLVAAAEQNGLVETERVSLAPVDCDDELLVFVRTRDRVQSK